MLIKFIIKIKNCTQSPDLKKINKKPRSKFKDTKTSFELLVVTYNKLTAKGRFTKKVNFRWKIWNQLLLKTLFYLTQTAIFWYPFF